MDKERISPYQLILLLAAFGVGTGLLLIPSIQIQFAQQGALLSTAFVLAPALGLSYLLASLNKMYPGQSLVQYSVSILGPTGKIVGLIFIWFAFHLGALVLRNIGNFINITILTETPLPVVYLVVVAFTAFALLLGIEVAARAFAFSIFIAIFFSGLLMIFTLPNADFSNMLPLLGSGWQSILHGSIYLSSFPVGEYILFGMLLFTLKHSKRSFILFIHGHTIAAIIGASVFIQVITVLGTDRASRSVIAILATLNAIPGSNILLIPFALTWLIFSLVKLFICYYAFVVGFAHWSHMEDYRPLVLPGGALMICIAMILFEGVGQHQQFNMVYWPAYSLPIEYGIPLFLWLAAMVKKLLQSRNTVS